MGKLQALIDKLKSTPMNVGSLKKLLPDFCTFKTLGQLNKHRSEIFKNKKCVVLLIPSDFSKIGHFVVLTAFGRYIEYFSSLSGSPTKETADLGQDGTNLIKLLGKNYAYNSKQFQSKSSTIEDCALHVLCRVYLKDLKLREYQQLFTNSIHLKNADDIVSLMTFLLLTEL
jgi:hypothetical protein